MVERYVAHHHTLILSSQQSSSVRWWALAVPRGTIPPAPRRRPPEEPWRLVEASLCPPSPPTQLRRKTREQENVSTLQYHKVTWPTIYQQKGSAWRHRICLMFVTVFSQLVPTSTMLATHNTNVEVKPALLKGYHTAKYAGTNSVCPLHSSHTHTLSLSFFLSLSLSLSLSLFLSLSLSSLLQYAFCIHQPQHAITFTLTQICKDWSESSPPVCWTFSKQTCVCVCMCVVQWRGILLCAQMTHMYSVDV